MRVFLSSANSRVSGLHAMNLNLATGLRQQGVDARILFTADENANAPLDAPRSEIPFQAVGSARDSLPARWAQLRTVLLRGAPCIWFPADFDLSVAVHRLPPEVVAVGVVHSDDPVHYDHVARLGHYWNAIVAVSASIADVVTTNDPLLASRLTVIPYGVATTPELGPPHPQSPIGPLRIVYTGRVAEYQKRVSRILEVARRLEEYGVESVFTIVGSGPDEELFMERVAASPVADRFVFRGFVPPHEMMAEYRDHDVFLLTSDFEGLPISLLEAMACGCAPVVSDISSGIPEVVESDENGYRVAPTDIDGFARRLADLHHDRDRLAALSRAAAATVQQRFSADTMVGSYRRLMDELLEDAASGAFQRPRRRPQLPQHLRPLFKHYLPRAVRHVLGRVSRGFRTE